MKERRRLGDKMKEIKLTDHSDITFNPLLIFSMLQLLGSSRAKQTSEGDCVATALISGLTTSNNNSKGSLRPIALLVGQ